MGRNINTKKLSDIFDIEEQDFTDTLDDIELDEDESIELDNIENLECLPANINSNLSIDTIESPLINNEEEKYISNELKELVADVKDVIGNAKYLINSGPSEDNVAAASQLFTSAATVLKEINKGLLQERRAKHNFELEKMKIKARQELAEFKAQQKDLGSGNVFIDNRQQHVSFSQESIIKDLLKIQNQDDAKEIIIDND